LKKSITREEAIILIQTHTSYVNPPEWLVDEVLLAYNRPQSKKIPSWKGRPGVPIGGLQS